jgi:hypothetical protein
MECKIIAVGDACIQNEHRTPKKVPQSTIHSKGMSRKIQDKMGKME